MKLHSAVILAKEISHRLKKNPDPQTETRFLNTLDRLIQDVKHSNADLSTWIQETDEYLKKR